MLDNKFHRGFSSERFNLRPEPKVKKDENGYYIMSLSENTKVYFDDYYGFLERTYEKATIERANSAARLSATALNKTETVAFYRAKLVILDVLMRSIRRFYTDGANLGVIMTPWCFGTVVLEKIEVHAERINKGEVQDPNVPDYPFYVTRYIQEIFKAVLMEMFDFPEKAFQMRWQYSELLKRYSGVLTDITSSLNSVLSKIKNYGSPR